MQFVLFIFALATGCSTYIFDGKSNLKIERSLKNLFEKLDNGDFSDLSDISDIGDSDILDEAEKFEENLINMIENCVEDNENKAELNDGRKDNFEVAENEEDNSGYSEGEEIEIQTTQKKNIRWTHREVLEPLASNWEPPSNENFSEDTEILEPLEYFKRYIPENLMKQMLDNTNIYALQNENGRFTPTNLQEIEIFIGLHLIMGCLKFPRISLYWDNTLGISVFQNSMTRNRFYKLRMNLHLVNNLERDPNDDDKFFKVRPIFNAIRERCLQLPQEQKMCVDEQMCPFKGHLSVKQYIRGKPTPWGIKLFLLCGESGIIYDFRLYQGKTTDIDKDFQTKYGQGPAVVMELSKIITTAHTQLFFDNYFSSYALLQYLKGKNILAAGTARINRFANPPFLPEKEIKKKPRGFMQQVFSEDHDIVLVKWFDNRIVSLASNFVGIGQPDQIKRWDKSTKKYIEISRPQVIQAYNSSMGGVDKMDFLIGLYRIFIRSRKWTLRLIFHAMDMAVCNSWLEYKRDCQRRGVEKKHVLDLLHFKMEIGNGLVKSGKVSNERRSRGRPSLQEDQENIISHRREKFEVRPAKCVRLDTVDHLPIHSGQTGPGRCKQAGCSGRSHFICQKCHVHLCLGKNRNCFTTFHLK